MMPSRQQSPSSSTSSSTKKAGHQRNPMACTNCRARKIKVNVVRRTSPLSPLIICQCDSSKRYPDHPCQRCVNRKLTCEYVAISHTTTSHTRSRSGSLGSTIYPSSPSQDPNGKSHTNGSHPHASARHSPLSTSFHSRNSQSDPYASFDGQYPSSHSSYSDSSPVESTASSYYGSYGPSNPNFGHNMVHPDSHMGQMPNIAIRSPYGGLSSGMPGMLNPVPDPGYYGRDPGYAWDGLSIPPVSQGQYTAGCVYHV